VVEEEEEGREEEVERREDADECKKQMDIAMFIFTCMLLVFSNRLIIRGRDLSLE
jgi:hypothetical protein